MTDLPHDLPPDHLLAAYLEGVLDASQTDAIEARLRTDPLAQRRLEQLQEALPEDGDFSKLMSATAPEGLEDRILERLEIEGLCEPELAGAEAAIEAALPTGLIETTLARLEDEGLMRPRAPQALSPRRAWPRLAAAALLVASLGFFGGSLYNSRDDRGRARLKEALSAARAESGSLRADKARLEARLAEIEGRLSAVSELEREAEAARALAAASEAARRAEVADLERRLSRQQEARRELEGRRGRFGRVKEELARLEKRFEGNVMDLARTTRDFQLLLEDKEVEIEFKDTQISSLRSELEWSRERLELAARDRASSQERLRELERLRERDRKQREETTPEPVEPPVMEVEAAAYVVAWSPDDRAWRRVKPGARLKQGTFLFTVGRSRLNAVQRRYDRLPRGYWQVANASRIEPLPSPPELKEVSR